MRAVSAVLSDGTLTGRRDFTATAAESTMQGNSSSSAQLERYRELTRVAYRVLRQCEQLPVAALSPMNPRHPLPPEDLELSNTLQSGKEMPGLVAIGKDWARCAASALRETVRLLRLKWKVGSLPGEVSGRPAEVVMKTWVFGGDTLANGTDFYYGTLPQMLEQRGISAVLLCGDALGGVAEDCIFARKALAQTQVRYVPEKILVPLWAPLVTACRQLRTSLKLRQLGQREANKKLRAVFAYACLACLRPFTTATSLYFYIAKAAVKIWRPKVFMTLYEGQTWEKPSWLGAKEGNPDCITVGYQHTVIMPHSLSLTSPNQGSWAMSGPDVILCLGEVTKNMMLAGHESCGTTLVQFGSFRLNSPSELPLQPRPRQQTVLVVPESGLLREAQLLFNFSMRVASLNTGYRFIFRCHPVAPFERILAHLEGNPEEFANIEISDCPAIGDDFRRSSVVLYRGSSSVLYAILYGLKPIYLHDGMPLCVDPLFELEKWRENVSLPGELVEVLQRYGSTLEEDAAKCWEGAVNYVRRYIEPVDDASMNRFLNAVGLIKEARVG